MLNRKKGTQPGTKILNLERVKKHYTKAPIETTERPCLCCGEDFPSQGKHNRMCNKCRYKDGDW